MKTLREMMDLIESAQTVAEMDKSQPSQERHGDYPLGIKNKDVSMVKPTTRKKVVQDLTKVLDKAFSKEKEVKEAEGEYKVYYMTAEDHKLMGRYASREEAEQRLNQLQTEYPDNKFIIWTNNKQGVAEEQLEETDADPVRRIEELFRNK
jgi:hypothetical protein